MINIKTMKNSDFVTQKITCIVYYMEIMIKQH